MPKRYSAKYSWTKRVGSFILHPSDRAAVMRELDGHIEDRIEAYIEAGLSREEAEAKAQTAMGDPTAVGKQLAALHKPWLRLLQISNPYNLLLSLLAYLPLFVFPLRYGIGQKLILAGFGLLLLCQFFFNRGHQFSNAQDPHGKTMEKMTLAAMEKYTPITTHGSYGGIGVTGPTQNIQATDSQRAQLLCWLLVFGIWFFSLVGFSDALYGVAAELAFADYIPLFLGLTLTAAADYLLARPKGNANKTILLLAACGLLAVWTTLLIL